MIYGATHFLNRFRAIPESEWCVGDYNDEDGRGCAIGHLGPESEKAAILERLVKKHITDGCIVEINDGDDPRFQEPTPKQRVLSALALIQRKGG